MPGIVLQHPGFSFENITSFPMSESTCSENFAATCASQDQSEPNGSCSLGSVCPSITSTVCENSDFPSRILRMPHMFKGDKPVRVASVYPGFAAGAQAPPSIDIGTEDEFSVLHDLENVWSDSHESGIDDSCFSGCSDGIMFGTHVCNMKDVLKQGTSFTVESSQSEYPSSPILVSPFSKCLNSSTSEDCWTADDIYSCDEFRMFEFKVRRCTRGRSHDWTECPFAHPGEKAKRRDPRKFHYSGTACPDFRKGNCRRGDACEFAHGVFECWLHPARYRTQPCKDGRNCTRRVCFFAHTQEQLRLLPAAAQATASTALKNIATCDLPSSPSSSGSLKSYFSHGIVSGKSYNEEFFDGSSRPVDLLGCMRGQGSFDGNRCAGGFPRIHHVCCGTSHVSSPISTLVGLPVSPPSISPPPSPSQSSVLSPHSWHGPSSPAISAGTACCGLLPHSAVRCPADSNIPCVQALLAATQSSSPSSINQWHLNSAPTLALPNLPQKSLYRSFSSAPTSPAGISPRNVTDLVSALHQLELRGANQIWLQQASPHASAPSPLSRASKNVSSYDNGWDMDVIEQDESRLERVESGKALRAEIYGKVPDKENHVSCDSNPDLTWVKDVLE